MNTGDAYAKYACGARYQDLPPHVIAKAKELILDSVGCALGAVQTDIGLATIKLAEDLGGAPEATVAGSRAKVSALNASYANCQLANLLDFDDTFDVYSPGHPGCAIVQTALAYGEATHASGQELLTAVVSGYEVTMRAGFATGSILWAVGAPSVAGSIGSAVVAARLLALDEKTTRAALDLLPASGSTPARRKWDVPPGVNVGTTKGNYGMQAWQGAFSALQARHGLTPLKWADGLLDVDRTGWYLMGLPLEGYSILTDGLSESYWTLKMSLKPTPSCRWTHVPITAVWEALEGRPVKAEEVDKVVIKGVQRLQRYEWDEMLQDQFSIPCTVALAITGAQPGPGWYTTGRFKDPDIKELAKKVVLERDPEAEAYEIETGRMMCTVEITFNSGEVKRASVKRIKGAPDNPLTREEQVAKFRANAAFLDPARVSRAIDRLTNLEWEKDVAALVEDLYCL